MIRVLMTGAGAPGGPGIIKALLKSNDIYLVACDMDPEASGRWLCENFYQIPKADHPDFISRIFYICEKEKINVIFPLVTNELFVFSLAKTIFEEKGIKVIVSDFSSLEIANNKSKLYQHLKNSQVLVPAFQIAKTKEELRNACLYLGYPAKEVCMKPSISNGSRGFRILTEDNNDYNLLFHAKPQSVYATLQNILSIIGNHNFPELLISEYLPGDEYTIDTYVYNASAILVLPRIRHKMSGGISVKGEFIQNEEIIKYCHEIISSMNLHGPIGIQVKKGTDGKYKILEINPRIQGSSVAALGAGINLPLLAVLSEYYGSPQNYNEVKWGVKFVRYFDEAYF